jgi:two-component system response regulator PilR (NtrC family)
MMQKSSAQVLVVDDEPDLRTLYELTLLREGYAVDTAGTVAQAWELLNQRRFDVVITDMRLPDGMGSDILSGLKEQQRPERCVVITAYGSAENAVESLKAGAFDYLTKPVDLKQFRSVIASALKTTSAAPAAARPSLSNAPPRNGDAALSRLVGTSAPMRAVKDRIAKVARSMAPVLVQGESGTGKELVALALHANSHRANGPWVPVNCSAIPENLLEAEFFGAKKGAYTGAHSDREGFFKAASGGTLFLDEIGDLPLAMQSKLLRAIQERRVRPVGADQEEAVDVRIVSATHKNLSAEIAAGRFRQDLFYRINVIDIAIAPLRERSEDLPALCLALLDRIAHESGVRPPPIGEEMLHALKRHPLHGNVRELENILHRAFALCDGTELQPDAVDANLAEKTLPQLPPVDLLNTVPAHKTPCPADLQSHLDQQEREILVQTLKQTKFNRTLAANRLGLTLRQMRYRIDRLGIELPTDQDDASESAG